MVYREPITMNQKIQGLLSLVTRPSRYIGGEVNGVRKDLGTDPRRLRFALAFPDVYEVGMSHLGIQILYQILNNHPDIACERVYAPWPDLERLMRERAIPLTTLESTTPLREMDVIGFSLQHELCYTNILNMLDLSGIPLYSRDRSIGHPLIIGGGPMAFNPEPVAEFFDAFVLGDGEEVILELAEAIMAGKEEGREGLLKRLSGIEGVYVPSFFEVAYYEDGRIKGITPLNFQSSIPNSQFYRRIRKRVVADLNKLPPLTRPVVPFTRVIHDRLVFEIARGCTRGCRFCQAGIIYRPLRERSPEEIIRLIEDSLKNTGYDEVSLLSLSTGDYSCIQDLLAGLMNHLAEKRVAISLPSLRVGTLAPRLAEEIKRVRKTGFTLAPEAGSERLRRVINKGMEEGELIETARRVFDLGWQSLKLYYMLGLPGETRTDLEGIIDLSRRVQEVGGKRARVNVSISTFVPKPHTPFQWEPQITLEECMERQAILKEGFKRNRMELKCHNARMGLLEGIFSRGDRRLSRTIKRAFELGCRFDSWVEWYRADLWERALRETGVDWAFYAYRRRDKDEVLPWDHLDTRVDKAFLYNEYERALRAEETPDCRDDICSACGICDQKVIKNITSPATKPPIPPLTKRGIKGARGGSRIRIRFSKTGDMRNLSHLEMVTTFTRAIRRGALPIRYSQGFHPLPRITFSPPLSVGIESVAEYAELVLDGYLPPEAVLERLNRVLPKGFKVLEAKTIPMRLPPLSRTLNEATYLVFLKDGVLTKPPNLEARLHSGGIKEMIEGFLSRKEITITQERNGIERKMDIRPLIKDIKEWRVGSVEAISITLRHGERGGVKPYEVMSEILNLPLVEARLIPMLKICELSETRY